MTEKNYQDYVFQDGRFIGDFEAMYRESAEVPWRQDTLAAEFYVDLDIAILQEMKRRFHFATIADVGAGLGYVTKRIKDEVMTPSSSTGESAVQGFEYSRTAVKLAGELFSDIPFSHLNLLEPLPQKLANTFDLVTVKDCIWYMLGDLNLFWDNLVRMSRGNLFVSQTFPDDSVFTGQDIYPTAASLVEDLRRRGFQVHHAICEMDVAHGSRESAHIFINELPNAILR